MEGSETVHFVPAIAVTQERIAFILAHPIRAALHRHRGDLVLHANTLCWHGALIAIAGRSGAGKSTTSAGLLQRGANLIVDDLTALRAGAHGQLVVHRGPADLHLTREVAQRLGLDQGVRPSPVRASKVVLTLEADAATPPRHQLDSWHWDPDPSAPGLNDLVLLEAGDGPDVEIRRLRGTDLFLALQHCIYGPLKPCDTPASFRLQALLARSVRVWRLQRPHRWCLDEVLDALEEALGAAAAPLGEDPPASAEPRLSPADG